MLCGAAHFHNSIVMTLNSVRIICISGTRLVKIKTKAGFNEYILFLINACSASAHQHSFVKDFMAVKNKH